MKKILIVSDDESIRMFYSDELMEEGYDVITCSAGPGIKKLIDEKRPDLIVVDISLERYGELKILQDIRDTRHELPILVCAVYPRLKDNPMSVHADYFIVKSSKVTELKSGVQMALEGVVPFDPSGTASDPLPMKKVFMKQTSFDWLAT